MRLDLEVTLKGHGRQWSRRYVSLRTSSRPESASVSCCLRAVTEKCTVPPVQAASRSEHHPPVRPYYEHRKEDQSKPELQIGRTSRHGQQEDTNKRDRADQGAHGGHHLGG